MAVGRMYDLDKETRNDMVYAMEYGITEIRAQLLRHVATTAKLIKTPIQQDFQLVAGTSRDCSSLCSKWLHPFSKRQRKV